MFESLADVFRHSGHHQRVHNKENVAEMKGGGFK